MLVKYPVFSLLAIVTLALGIGANTAIFSVVNSVLLRSLPYEDPDRIVTLWENNTKEGIARDDVSPANFLIGVSGNRFFQKSLSRIQTVWIIPGQKSLK